jgi:MFS family permease
MLLPFIALYIAVFLLMTGVGLLGTLLPLRMTLEGVPSHTVGLVMSSYYLGMVAGSFYCHRLIQSVGHIRAFTAFAAVTTAIVMLHGIYVSPLFWAVLRLLTGISTIGIYMVIESWLNECSEPQSRGKVLSIYMVMSYLGMGLSQQLLHLIGVEGLQLFFTVGLLLALCLVPVAVTHGIHPKLPEFKSFSVWRTFRKAPTGMIGCFAAGLLNSAFYALAPVFCVQNGLSVAQLSSVMTLTIFGGLLLQWPMGNISDRFDRTFVLAFIGVMIALLSLLAMSTAGHSFALFLAIMAIFGGLTFTVYPVSVARAHDLSDFIDIVPVSSVLLLLYGCGATAGPVLASSVMTAMHSEYGLFAYSSSVAAVFAITVFYLRKKELVRVVPAEDNAEFVLLKNTSPVIVAIDPRTDPEELEQKLPTE